ncbi:glycosyltransferase family 4 protein [Paracoccus sp. MC1862]|nr:glycosyltransferase family 4 protein [Paracoccus sp. MC1862]
MRVLMSTDAVGGVWQYSLELASALDAEVVLAVLGPMADTDQRAAAEVAVVRLVDTGLPLDWLSDGPAPVLAAADAIARLACEMGADVVHLNTPALAAARFAQPVVAVNHGCLGTWWDAARGGPVEPALAWLPELVGQGLRAADRVVAPTRAYAEATACRYGLTVTPTAVHNGRTQLALPTIPQGDFSGAGSLPVMPKAGPGRETSMPTGGKTGLHGRTPLRSLSGARPAHGAPCLPLGAPHPFHGALTIGRLWDEVKDTATLDAAAALLDAPFIAIGATRAPHGATVTPAHLQATGPLPADQIAHWLSRRPVFVSAARFEPFGLAVLEAAQAGCPLVLSNIPTFRELWDGAATFVSPGDAAGFTKAIAALLSDPARHAALGQAARQRAARYTPAAMAAEMSGIYRDLLSAKDKAA